MAPVLAKQGKEVEWETLVAACHAEEIDLRAGYQYAYMPVLS